MLDRANDVRHFDVTRLVGAAILIGAILACGGPRAGAAAPVFRDVTANAGIDYVHNTSNDSLFGTMSGGAAAGDFDGDGWVDLYVTRIDGPDILYRNQGDGTFSDVSATALGGVSIDPRTNGPVWGDIDNDGDLDLYVTTWGGPQNYLLINQAGTFHEEAIDRGAAIDPGDRRTGASATLGDYDGDGFLDLYTTEWVDQFRTVSHSRLLRNRGRAKPGYFVDATEAAGVRSEIPSRSFAPRFSDLDGDGRLDLTVASDFGNSKIYWNRGDGTFLDGTDASGANRDRSAMGSTIGDVDNDGDLDWFLGNINIDGNNLYLNQLSEGASRTFVDRAADAGVEQSGWTWGSSFLDYDNDGDLDLIVTNGSNQDEATDYRVDPVYLFRNDTVPGGDVRFTDVSQSTFLPRDRQIGSGLLVFDYDRDGDQDVLIVNGGAGQGPVLYRNDGGNAGNFLRVELTGRRSNRDGYGARITVTPDENDPASILVRDVDAGSNFLGQNEAAAHFGLGDRDDRIDRIDIRWPSGLVQTFFDVAPNTVLTAVEPVPEPATGTLAWLSLPLLRLLRPRRRTRSIIAKPRLPADGGNR